jgi:large subunit ribosomal protein L2
MTRFLRPYTPSNRHRRIADFQNLTTSQWTKTLTSALHRSHGRNHRGVQTSRHRGGGHKRRYRHVQFNRTKIDMVGLVKTIEYDPNRKARICLVHYEDGAKQYILQAEGMQPNMTVAASLQAPIECGNCLPLFQIPLGTEVHNIECFPGGGGKLARCAGSVARVIAQEGQYTSLRLPSGEIRLIFNQCWATIGKVGNIDHMNIVLGKAGASRWLGRRPKVRGSVMNPVDHPHGGGEGRCPVGRSRPVSLWGKPALGVRTRQPKKYSRKAILKRRKGFK